jgi:predicted Fe-Mo cluster-binding NifX family protein
MRKNLTILYLVLFLSTYFMQVQQCLSLTRNSDVDSSKSSNRIAIAAVGDSVTSEISKMAGRAPYYLVFDGNGVFLKSIKNPAQNRGRGASSVVVNLLLKESVKTVIAGRFGDKMIRQLEANKIEYHERAGIVKKTVKTFIKDKRSKNAQK